jgi:uncharacterized protein (DUF4415 family)
MKEKSLKPPFSRELTAEEFAALPDELIDTSDIPPLGKDFWENAVLMHPEDWKKQQLTLRVDAEVIRYFKSQGRGYQTRMNEVLKTYVNAMRKS